MYFLSAYSAGFDDLGSPPASKEAVNNLLLVTITKTHLKGKDV